MLLPGVGVCLQYECTDFQASRVGNAFDGWDAGTRRSGGHCEGLSGGTTYSPAETEGSREDI